MQDHCLSCLFVTASSSSYLFIQVSFRKNNDETDEVKMTQSKEYTPRVKNNGQEKETTITYCSWWECLPSCLFSCLPFQLKRKEVMRQDHRRSLFIITTLFQREREEVPFRFHSCLHPWSVWFIVKNEGGDEEDLSLCHECVKSEPLTSPSSLLIKEEVHMKKSGSRNLNEDS